MFISQSNNKNYIKTIRKKNRKMVARNGLKFQKKIKEIEQDEEVICTIRKDSNHISNQFLAIQ